MSKRKFTTVALGFPYGTQSSSRFMRDLFVLGKHDALRCGNRIRNHLFNASGANVTNARNEITEAFLDKTDADWLLFLDTDMVFDGVDGRAGPDLVERLVASADPEERPIVGALCYKWRGGREAVPTIYGLSDAHVLEYSSIPPHSGLIPCVTGTGCLLIHRKVLTALRERHPKPYQWFKEDEVSGLPIGEDITFGIRALAAGFPTHVDTSIIVGHEKTIVVDHNVYLAQHHRPAESVAVLVPVLNRPHNVAPLVESFAASGTPGRLMFIANSDDHAELNAISEAGAEVIVTDRGTTWPIKINDGFAGTDEPWVLLGADDIRFTPGWWDATAPARAAGFGVIGTNDLGNKAVLAGEHATHPLVSRAYVNKYGTLDRAGEVVHEGYAHWFVDNELIETAKARGAWTPCLDAVVEHLHPYWGKSESDDVYALGEANRRTDQARFEERMQQLKAAV